MKICTKCGDTKSYLDFNKKARNNDGYERYCKTCHKLYNKHHYQVNKEIYKTRANINRILYIEWYKNIKGKLKCEQCPEKHISTLDFHHVRDKQDTIAHLASQQTQKKKVLEEMSKCIVLCANCHRKEHHMGIA